MKSLFNRIKFLFCKKGELYSYLEKTLGFVPGNLEYYEQAITHRSATVRKSDGRISNNERLEFLGDAVIETVISDILYHQYPRKDEGFLSTMRSKLVERKNLGRIAKQIGLDKMVRIELKHQQSESHNSYIGGNAFEALVGAIYLDKGFKASQRFIHRLMDQGYINMEKTARVEENFKSVLLEWGQKHKVEVKFITVWEEANAHGKEPFCCAAMIEGRKIATGKGYSKKECHQIAAKKAFAAMRRNPNFERSVLQMRLIRMVIQDMLPYAQPQRKILDRVNED